MIGCLRTRVRKQPIVALYFESELVLKLITSRPDPILVLTLIYPSYYAPKFEKVKGTYCFGLVRPSVRRSVRPSIQNLRYGIEIS